MSKVVRSVVLCWEMGMKIAVQRVPTGRSPLICAEGLARERTPEKMRISEQGEVRSTTPWRVLYPS